jgi:hypothetical protein
MWILVRTRSSIRQELQFKYHRPDDCQHGLDARSSDMKIADSTSTVRTSAYLGPDARSTSMEITCWRSTIRTAILLGLDAQSLICKLLAADVRPSGRLCLTVRTRISNRKDFSTKFLEKSVTQFSVQTALVHRPDSVCIYHYSCPFEPQPIYRGPWALRTARIRYWIPLELRELFLRLLELICTLSSHCKCAVAALQLKSILRVGPKVKYFIEDPFR